MRNEKTDPWMKIPIELPTCVSRSEVTDIHSSAHGQDCLQSVIEI
uniref:Uncharacterized protein n=1 Tax=Arundo donax TaxID=35708 RepID=A0A0A9AEL1_ARUDO